MREMRVRREKRRENEKWVRVRWGEIPGVTNFE
jgi:hypothetical protein